MQAYDQLNRLKGDSIIVSHDSLAYFCREFHLNQVSLEKHGKQPLPKDIRNMLQKIDRDKVLCVIAPKQYDDRAAKLVAGNLQLPIHTFDLLNPNLMDNLWDLTQLIAESR